METLEKNFIDVPSIEPRLKHATIFQVFNSLSGGESLIIHNDHDPKPVYYQLLAEHGDIFTWEYLKQGPEWWDIRVTKKKDEDKETIGEIAVKDIRKAEVFKKYGIDFCCGGKKTIAEVCAEKNIDAAEIEEELNRIDKQARTSNISYNDWNLDFLADYIVNTHHSYVRKYLPEVAAYALKVARVHGNNHPELVSVLKLVQDIDEELTSHMDEEEQVLFPNIKKVVHAKNNGTTLKNAEKDLDSLIEEMEQEHSSVGSYFDKIRELTGDYTPPADACASYKLLFNMLPEFEDDLHIHIHLENNILFPKAIEMEKSLVN